MEFFCHEGGADQAFFQFYLYQNPDVSIPLNWVLSPRVADYIWSEEFLLPGNDAELRKLRTILSH